MVAYDAEDKDNETTAITATANLKIEFDRSDVDFWFTQLEMHLQTAGVGKQWTKRLLLHKQLPADVISELKDLLRKSQAEAGATPYLDLKTRILQTWGRKPEEAYAEAKGMVMVNKPSQLANQLVNIICCKHPNLVGCCAAGVIAGMWREKLPPQVRLQVASLKLDDGNFTQHLQKADDAFASIKGAEVAGLDFDTSADAPALQVAAFKPKPKKKSDKPARDKPHADGPPPEACNTHWKYGKAAFKCRKPEVCPWAKYCENKNNKK